MKIKICKSKDLYHHLIVLIFWFIFAYMIGNIMYWQTSRTDIWRVVYYISLFIVFFLDVVFIVFHGLNRRKVPTFCLMVFGFLAYETIVSFTSSTFSLPSLVLDGFTWPLTFVVFYLYTIYAGKDVVIRALKNSLVIGTIICMVLLINNIRIHLSSTLDGLQGGVISPVYFLLSCLGLILLMGDSREKFIFSILIAAMIIIPAKRTGFLIIIIGVIAYFWFEARMENRLTKRIRRYGRYVLIGVVILIVGLWAINRFDLQIITRMLDSTDDGGSGRLLIWQRVLSYFGESSGVQQLFGHGFHAVPNIVVPLGRSIYAHNSYLEALIDLGLVGLLWLIGIVISLIVKTFKMLKERYTFAPVLIYSIVEILVLSLLSYFFEISSYTMLVAVLWGICLGDFQKEKATKSMKSDESDKSNTLRLSSENLPIIFGKDQHTDLTKPPI